jgi:CHRD domain
LQKLLIFTPNTAYMKLIRLSALALLIAGSSFLFTSCDRDDAEEENYYSATLQLKGSNEIPANTSTATGTVFAEYSKLNKTLSYTINWSGLTGPVAAMHIHGVADPATNIGIIQNIITSSNGLASPNPTLYGTSGSFRASLFADGISVKEADILNGKYYLNIHTATFPGGEIRAQLQLRN